MHPGLGVKLVASAAKGGADVVGKVWTLLENNKPMFEMNVEVGEGINVHPDGVSLADRIAFPHVQVRRLKDHTYKYRSWVKLIEADTSASWYCVPYEGGLYIKGAMMMSSVKRVWPANKLSVTVSFREPLFTQGDEYVVACQPLLITARHSSPFNARVDPTIASISADGQIEVSPHGFDPEQLEGWLTETRAKAREPLKELVATQAKEGKPARRTAKPRATGKGSSAQKGSKRS